MPFILIMLLLGCILGIAFLIITILLRKRIPGWGIYMMIIAGGLVFAACAVTLLCISFFMT